MDDKATTIRPVWLGILSIFLAVCQVHAIVQTDVNVPLIMDSANGEPGFPDQYIIGYSSSVTVSRNSDSIYVGYSKSFIDLTVRNGSLYKTGNSYVGFAGQSNSATVTGTGTHWQNFNSFYVGYKGFDHSLQISKGGKLSFGSDSEGTAVLMLGYDTTSASNTVIVTGSGSTLMGDGTFYVGVLGHSNSLQVENSGEVEVNKFYVGFHASGSNNSVLISGTGSLLKITQGDDSYVGGQGGANSLLIENGGKLVSEGRLSVGSGALAVRSNSNSIVLTGDNSSMELAGELLVGGFGSSNSLSVADRAVVSVASSRVGAFGEDNHITITGYGAIFDNQGNMVIGEEGSQNSVIVRNGALVKLGGELRVNELGGSENTLRLDGGYFAFAGDQTSAVQGFLDDGIIQIWNGDAWERAIEGEGFEFRYFLTDEDAFAFTGYHDLGGYTILTSYAFAIPEPTTYGFIAGAVLAAAFYRRKRF